MPLRLVKAMGEGFSFGAACAKLGISPRTGYDWRDSHEKWEEAFELGKGYRLKFLEEQAIEILYDSTDRSAAMIIFLLKTHDREMYGDKVETKDTTENPQSDIPDDKLDAQIIRIMRQRGLKVVGD